MKIKLIKADGSFDSYLNITDVVNSDLYSVATIKRKSDSKIFKCYARNGRIQINRPCHKSWFINDEDYEELELNNINTNIFNILEIVYD
jgi:hypothetical protein